MFFRLFFPKDVDKEAYIYNLLFFVFSIYVFALPFTVGTAIKNISFVILILLSIYIYIKNINININFKISIVEIFLILYIIFSLLSIYSSKVDIENSLISMKNGIFQQAILYLFILLFFNKKKYFVLLIKTMIFSYIAIIFLSSLEIISTILNNEFSFNRNQNGNFLFFKAFSHTAVIHFPVLVGSFFYFKKISFFYKCILLLALIVSYLLIFLYQSTTATCISSLILIYFLFKFLYKKIIFILISIIFILISSFEISSNFSFIKKLSDVNQYDFSNSYALSGRNGLWRGTLMCMEKKYWFGYGYGWKKMQIVCNTPEFLEKLENSNNRWWLSHYKSAGYGKINPHSTYFEILFTGGIVSLVLFLILTIYLIKISFDKFSYDEVSCFIFPILLSYFINSFMNGYWGDSYQAKLLFVFIAFLVAIAKNYGDFSGSRQ